MGVSALADGGSELGWAEGLAEVGVSCGCSIDPGVVVLEEFLELG